MSSDPAELIREARDDTRNQHPDLVDRLAAALEEKCQVEEALVSKVESYRQSRMKLQDRLARAEELLLRMMDPRSGASVPGVRAYLQENGLLREGGADE